MVPNIHALIQQFLQDKSVTLLLNEEHLASTGRYIKAGLVPFIGIDTLQFCVMKPQGKIESLGDPGFQLCKGTRMHKVPGIGWRDIKPSQERALEIESLLQTALREAIEELGLKLDNITQLYNVGPYHFSSATTGNRKEMWLFAASVKDENAFLEMNEIAKTTQERKWLTSSEFELVARKDHFPILQDIEKKLIASLSKG